MTLRRLRVGPDRARRAARRWSSWSSPRALPRAPSRRRVGLADPVADATRRRSSPPSPAPTRSASWPGCSRRSSRRCSSSWSRSTTSSTTSASRPRSAGRSSLLTLDRPDARHPALPRASSCRSAGCSSSSPRSRRSSSATRAIAIKARIAQQELFKERGINPLAGCLPLLLQMPLLFIMYSVIQQRPDQRRPVAMLDVFGVQVVPLTCNNINPATGQPDAALGPVHQHDHPVPRDVDRRQPAVDDLLGHDRRLRARDQHPGHRLGGAAARPVADDAAAADPRTTTRTPGSSARRCCFLPLISVVYGGFLPAGLFIYWITATIFSIVQQYLIVGWGGMFPLFGWTPGVRARTTRRDSRCPCPHRPSQASARRS